MRDASKSCRFSFNSWRTRELETQLQFLMESEDPNTVFWIERRGFRGSSRQNVFLQATPIDVAPILKTCLFDQLDCVVLTSATLAVGGGFEYIRQRLGMEQARELVLPSHFDYENQALLYIPPDLPDPPCGPAGRACGTRGRNLA